MNEYNPVIGNAVPGGAGTPSIPLPHAATHKTGGSDSIKLDEFATPDDNTNLDATTSEHGLLKKLSGNASEFLNGAGNWAVPSGSNPTLDDAYNNSGGASSIGIDAGDVTWSLSGAYSFALDLSAASGTADGFQVVDGTDQFNLIHKGADLLDLDADLQNADINASGNISLTAAGTLTLITPTIADFTNATHDHADAAGGGTIAITDLDASNWSLFYSDGSGDVQELANGASGYILQSNGASAAPSWVAAPSVTPTLDDAYNNSGGASSIAVDAGDLTWNISNAYSFVVDISGVTNVTDGFHVLNGTDNFRLRRLGADIIDLDATIRVFDIGASGWFGIRGGGDSHIRVTGYDLEISTLTTGDINMSSVGDLNIDANQLGFFGVAAVGQPSAYTQTYSTNTKTHSARTAQTLTDNSGGSADTTIAQITQAANAESADIGPTADAIADLAAQVNNLLTDQQNTAQVLNAIIDDLQALGLVTP